MTIAVVNGMSEDTSHELNDDCCRELNELNDDTKHEQND
jgi:hypothetical protein